MGPRPYSERSVLPSDASTSSISVESDMAQLTVDTSLGSLSSATTSSPTDEDILSEAAELPQDEMEISLLSSVLYPTPAETMPFDHAFPDFIRQLTNEQNLSNVHSLKLKVISSLVSLQRMSLYTANLRELDLEGSILGSLRDIGCNLKHLQVLKVGNCQLDSLDGTFGLTSLRQFYAQKNLISDVSPCSNLSHIHHIDLSNNRIRNIAYAGFLSVCRRLKSIVFAGNPATQLSDYRSHVQRILPQLKSLDGVPFSYEENGEGALDSSGENKPGESQDKVSEECVYNIPAENESRRTIETAAAGKLFEQTSEEVNKGCNYEIHEILKQDTAHGRNYCLQSTRRDENLLFKQCGTGIVEFQTEDPYSNLSHCEDEKNNLTLPPLRLHKAEPKRLLSSEPLFSRASTSAEKLGEGDEESLPFSSKVDLHNSKLSELTKDQILTSFKRPSTANEFQSNTKPTDYANDRNDRRPHTAGSELSNPSGSRKNKITHGSLTTGFPICGNLAVALRNRRKREENQSNEEIQSLNKTD